MRQRNTCSIWRLQINCSARRTDAVKLDIYCTSCSVRVVRLGAYSFFPILTQNLQSSCIQNSAVKISVPLVIYWRWRTQTRIFAGIVPDDLEFVRSLMFLIAAKCTVDCIVGLEIYYAFRYGTITVELNTYYQNCSTSYILTEASFYWLRYILQ